MAKLFDTGIFSVIGLDSAIGADWSLGFYLANSATETDTFTTPDLNVANANPVPASADGRFPQIWLDAGDYKYVLYDDQGVPKVTVDDYNVPTDAPEIDAGLTNFIEGNEPLPIASGGTGETSAANAIEALGGLPTTGGTVTGDITRSTKGVLHYWETAAMNKGQWFLTASGASDPRGGLPGQVWLKY